MFMFSKGWEKAHLEFEFGCTVPVPEVGVGYGHLT